MIIKILLLPRNYFIIYHMQLKCVQLGCGSFCHSEQFGELEVNSAM